MRTHDRMVRDTVRAHGGMSGGRSVGCLTLRVIRLVLILVCIPLVIGCSDEAAGTDSESPEPAAGTTPRSASTRVPEPRNSVASVSSDSSGKDFELVASEYMCDDEAACDPDDMLAATTEEEALWLLKYGYPSRNDLERLESLPLAVLAEEAAAGDLAAMAVYARQYADASQNTMGGVALAMRAAERGSIYAYHAIADIYATDDNELNDMDAGAYLRVAYVLGDGKAHRQLAKRYPRLTISQHYQIDDRAAGLLGRSGLAAGARRPIAEL